MVIGSKGSADRDSETEISDTFIGWLPTVATHQMGPNIQFYSQTRPGWHASDKSVDLIFRRRRLLRFLNNTSKTSCVDKK
jgi:hypothetical protein